MYYAFNVLLLMVSWDFTKTIFSLWKFVDVAKYMCPQEIMKEDLRTSMHACISHTWASRWNEEITKQTEELQ